MVIEPATGLQFVELSHEWGHHTPPFPGFKDIEVRRVATHAKQGVLTQHVVLSMHHGTHLNAPIYLAQRGKGAGELPLDLFFGHAVVLEIPKGEWEYVEPADLEASGAEIREGELVIINTGWHVHYSDNMEYFSHGPGLSKAAAQWLIDRKVKLVGIDTATIDHPLATSLAQQHRFVGPWVVEVPRRYKNRTGREVTEDFPEWMPAHRLLLQAGIPTIENVGAEVDLLNGTRFAFHAYPWFWPEADACVIRLVGITDPSGAYRLENGAAA